jgi:hypothetical protein
MKRIYLSLACLYACTLPSHALLLSFDSGSTTEGSGRPIAVAFSVDNAYLETMDEFGELLPIAVWTPIEPARIGNPADAGYGEAVSGNGALNAEFDQILFTFEAPVYLREFSTMLDDSSFGTLGVSKIQFFDATDGLLAEISIDQTQPGVRAQWEGAPVAGVTKILLPGGAYYDDVTVNVPESGPGIGLVGWLSLVVVRRWLPRAPRRHV